MATQSIKRRNRRVSSLFLVAIIVIAAVVTFTLYAGTSGASTLVISPPSTTSGAKADVSDLSASFSGVLGQAKKTKGVVLSKLTFGAPADSSNTTIFFYWTDPGQASGVLLNPNAFLETRVYHISTSCDPADQRTFFDEDVNDNVTVCPDPVSASNFTAMSIENATAIFRPSVTNQNVLYILADINVPGGAPAGQQSQLSELTFILEIS